MADWYRSTFLSLSIPSFRLLWLGTMVAFVAFFMSTVVQSVVAFELTGRNDAVGSVVFAQGIAMAALGPIGGAFADRWSKRRVIAAGQLLAASVFATLGFLMATDSIHLAYLAAGSLLMGATFAFLGPARQALAVEYVPDHMRGNAMAMNNVANTGSRVFGPAIAGFLLGWHVAGATGAYFTMAGLYAASALSVAWLPHSPPSKHSSQTHVFEDLFAGFRYVGQHAELRLVLAFFVVVILMGFPHVTVLPGLLENDLGYPAADVSGLFLASAIGAVTASVGVARLADSPRARIAYSGLAIGFGVGLVGLALAPSYKIAAAMMMLIGACSGGFQALNAGVIARLTEPVFIGRVMSLTLLAFAGFGLMSLPYGMLADAVGERQTLMTMGVSVIALSIVFSVGLARLSRHPGPDAPHD
jgi:MFS family permease